MDYTVCGVVDMIVCGMVDRTFREIMDRTVVDAVQCGLLYLRI